MCPEEDLLGLVLSSSFPDPKNQILITPVYPSETIPFVPIFRENLPTDRPEVLIFIFGTKPGRKKFPPGLAESFNSDKMEVFNVWLQNQQCLKRVDLAYRRRMKIAQRNRNLYGYRKERDLHVMYPKKPDTVKGIIARKTAAGLAVPDPEVPDDKEDM